MKNWYTTRDGVNLQHKSKPISTGKRIFLSEAQAKLHGSKVVKADAPKSVDDVGVKQEWFDYQSTISKDKPSPSNQGEPTKKEK